MVQGRMGNNTASPALWGRVQRSCRSAAWDEDKLEGQKLEPEPRQRVPIGWSLGNWASGWRERIITRSRLVEICSEKMVGWDGRWHAVRPGGDGPARRRRVSREEAAEDWRINQEKADRSQQTIVERTPALIDSLALRRGFVLNNHEARMPKPDA
ncbi:uncharacterized protein PADG_06743 [Paracoccidioides brasiliensis Pb18]|uniref:Uncharacterized protein n=1 Tax=Paracoccidioides brasiliensis (strain Pb18) TaxID=502780 RepID=C1GHK7_PARBD|nr:uncharacterized protein PADG_06743 [Paracoccidioides brasiliensis Pb18]EEH50665.2 hypothetical protein PADG_06743 [Paracoccidioides brasiliensis Pb18]